MYAIIIFIVLLQLFLIQSQITPANWTCYDSMAGGFAQVVPNQSPNSCFQRFCGEKNFILYEIQLAMTYKYAAQVVCVCDATDCVVQNITLFGNNTADLSQTNKTLSAATTSHVEIMTTTSGFSPGANILNYTKSLATGRTFFSTESSSPLSQMLSNYETYLTRAASISFS